MKIETHDNVITVHADNGQFMGMLGTHKTRYQLAKHPNSIMGKAYNRLIEKTRNYEAFIKEQGKIV